MPAPQPTSSLHRPGLPAVAMKIALPLTDADAFAVHYGKARRFAVFEIDPETLEIRRRVTVCPADNRPCHWPVLLQAAGADVMLTGGMGRPARARMLAHGLAVVTGVAAGKPEALVKDWLIGTLDTGDNACNGSHGGTGHCPGHTHHAGGGHDHDHGCS